MNTGSRSSRTRYNSQFNRMQCIQKSVRFWRNMAPATKANWNNFAATYPQPTKKDPAKFLSGYQLFIKRNSYLFLIEGLNSSFMESPTMESLPSGNATFEIKEGNNCMDMTELYIQNFGCIPSPGQFVLFMAIPMSATSGQFFTPITNSLEIEAVYMDGFFLNVVLPAGIKNIIFSVYLSKPVSKGQSYAGTKVRFMGCFSSKTFLELTDTPASYAGQQGKFVAVNAGQNALEFVPAPSGGLTCADLVNCPTIISIFASITNINNTFVNSGLSAVPSLLWGIFYNWYAVTNVKNINPVGWKTATNAEWATMLTFLGGATIAGGKLRESSFQYWDSPNTGATNSSKFNARGSGYRSYLNGTFTIKFRTQLFYTANEYNANLAYIRQLSWDRILVDNPINEKWSGYSHRPMKITTTLKDGQMGSCIGRSGRVYRTICIGTQEWFADNYAETTYQDGTVIPEITSNSAWIADRTGALCAPDNLWPNV
jgi:uncharacterized protein (TIGR02145 family)